MYVNVENNNLNALKCIYEKIHEFFDGIHADKNDSIEELIELYSNDDNFLNEKKIISESLNEIVSILKPLDGLQYELYHFMSIRRIICYILNDINIFINNLSFVYELLVNFFNLIHMKLLNKKGYSDNYDKFCKYLDSQEDFFYTEIFEYDDKYEDLIVEVTNILW